MGALDHLPGFYLRPVSAARVGKQPPDSQNDDHHSDQD